MPTTTLLAPPRIFRISYVSLENENAEIKKTPLQSFVQPWIFLIILWLRNLFHIRNRVLTCGSVFQQLYISEVHL